jgi:hypothetical protein
LAVNGQSIADARELSREIAALKPGDKASLSVWRDRVRSAFCCHSSRTFCLRLRLSIFLDSRSPTRRVFSGRAGRSIAKAYARAAASPDALKPAPYPVERVLTQAMRDQGTNIDRMQAWTAVSDVVVIAARAARRCSAFVWPALSLG